MWWMHGIGGLGMGIGMLFWLALLGGLVAFVLWVVRRLPAHDGTGSGADALEILRRRYARGELSRQQHEQMKRDLDA